MLISAGGGACRQHFYSCSMSLNRKHALYMHYSDDIYIYYILYIYALNMCMYSKLGILYDNLPGIQKLRARL